MLFEHAKDNNSNENTSQKPSSEKPKPPANRYIKEDQQPTKKSNKK
ncbi:hypothetical protein GF373_03455 [bacterium]|nr:hypothetical protein [bacterium]